ncbi:hypothetical protein X797_009455 [Metarhizium robertsii]|uniref:Uncharacterized protein n=1 Tax=Metarhizium robertsii TaxID=568076 RepID=A0A014MZ59_9HYPO|nr:hypothetical protein X797_009455 [Metarhizium robertsii]
MAGYQTITKAFNLDPTAPREQAIANHFIKSFNRNVFQRLVVEWTVEGNLSFREPENKRLRTFFEYLNPFVASTDAHVGHDTIRKRAVAEFEKHKGKVIEVLRNAPGLVHSRPGVFEELSVQRFPATSAFPNYTTWPRLPFGRKEVGGS